MVRTPPTTTGGSDGAGGEHEDGDADEADGGAGVVPAVGAEALGGVVARTAVDDGVRLHFGPGTDIAEVARLAAAEQDCCRFFRFTLSIDTTGVTLEVRAPAEAIDIVTALFGAPA